MRNYIKKIPFIGAIIKSVYRKYINPIKPFTNSEDYWIERYDTGGNSGDGLYKKLADFKAKLLNDFVREENIQSVIEYGCGDGNQLLLADYPSYTGFDVSPKAVTICKDKFSGDTTKKFRVMNEYSDDKAQLTLSLDVIYHLVEDGIFDEYMQRLFSSVEKFVIIYFSNTNENNEDRLAHVKHRKFSNRVEEQNPEWKLRNFIANKYPYNTDTETGSFADFYIYEKVS